MRLPILTAALLTGLAVFSVPAIAQTSFGGTRNQTLPTNQAEWMRSVESELMASLRNANSSLAVFGVHRAITMTAAVSIAMDGRVVNVALREGSGRPSLDEGAVRALSRVKRVQPFTPDMVSRMPGGIVVELGIGTTRQ